MKIFSTEVYNLNLKDEENKKKCGLSGKGDIMENIKQSMKEYFIRMFEVYEKKGQSLKVPFDPRVPTEMYVGSEDKEGYIIWKTVERKEPVINEKLSSEVGFSIHNSLVDFLSSYYFLEMSGIFGDYEVYFDRIVPNTILKNFVVRRYIGLETTAEKMDLIQLGVITKNNNDNLLMCFVNDTGQIVYYDYDKGNIEVISDSLSELISNLEPRC